MSHKNLFHIHNKQHLLMEIFMQFMAVKAKIWWNNKESSFSETWCTGIMPWKSRVDRFMQQLKTSKIFVIRICQHSRYWTEDSGCRTLKDVSVSCRKQIHQHLIDRAVGQFQKRQALVIADYNSLLSVVQALTDLQQTHVMLTSV